MASPNAAPRAATARERVRAELSREIKEEARRQLAASGAGGLSLRAVARELGMVSSALYRYYPSRDELLTALIIDAYNALGAAAETATAAGQGPGQAPAGKAGPARGRWTAACHAVRDWALANPHEYALIYGSPVPGYRAPEATIGPAARVPLAFVGLLGEALARGELAGPSAAGPSAAGPSTAGPSTVGAAAGALPVTGLLAEQAGALSAALARPASGPGGAAAGAAPATLPPDVLVRAVIAWTQLFGMISFELFGQFVGSFEPADALFGHAAEQLAAFVGLR
jgi:AcrR family transcriptional regulator